MLFSEVGKKNDTGFEMILSGFPYFISFSQTNKGRRRRRRLCYLRYVPLLAWRGEKDKQRENLNYGVYVALASLIK